MKIGEKTGKLKNIPLTMLAIATAFPYLTAKPRAVWTATKSEK